ncbi:MAG TPA: hypothetical protein VJU77_02090 [Chthoniobacterales bacterium]|nr:hypothetical protein [Chthoniobacterales bacterium]
MARLHEYQGKAILADLGMNAAAFNGIFMIARTPGLVAHVLQEQTREKPMRRIDPFKHGYDGPPPRGISDGNPKSQDPNPPLPGTGSAVASPKKKGAQR